HLRLPNGQIARSAWKELQRPLEKVRIAHNVKVRINGHYEIGEVQYFAQLAVDKGAQFATVAIILLYPRPDADLLNLLYRTVWSCKFQGDNSLQVAEVQNIDAVVAMVLHTPRLPSGITEECFFWLRSQVLDWWLLKRRMMKMTISDNK
ncbi:hypothetical protein HYDPIDRAFT_91823, partial [Hydnomerulius pinastri MD-312]